MSKVAKIAIIGAGPAGLIAAERLASVGQRVTVFDHMPTPGRKFLMAGRGGLNLTHSEPLEKFITRYSRDAPGASPDAVINAVEAYTPRQLIEWCEGLGQETFVGSSRRVFPKSLKASPLLRAWLQRLNALGVEFRFNARWVGFDVSKRPLFEFKDKPEAAAPFDCDAMILALGGASWPRLGSDGKWQHVLAKHDVPIVPITAANCGVRIAWSDHLISRHAGAPLKRIALRLGSQVWRGEAVITKTGLEGQALYSASAAMRRELARNRTATIELDLRPDEAVEALTQRLRSSARGSQSLSTYLRKTLSLTPAAIVLLHEANPKDVPKDPEALAQRLKAVPLTVTGLAGLERAISSAGGIALSGLDEALMLKALPGVFVAGEMLDYDAPTGGYLLQAAFATGVLAANGALAWVSRNKLLQTA